MTAETRSAELCATHDLSQLHIFKQGNMWRVFGSRVRRALEGRKMVFRYFDKNGKWQTND